ncbi:hypothetical protein P280DRAFT_520141 [Massarina eburnea CBS 473.64]|uniref:C2H2-type domain-containing protein n=1 Tax=Massarina eburnea CBS 473.64 TaxID=1395130 RepID=A0A6A6RT61_9PLEO|nr:hypothetical protein P280DRAFT_520141 [Massarina eburnea CBS 473.64]
MGSRPPTASTFDDRRLNRIYAILTASSHPTISRETDYSSVAYIKHEARERQQSQSVANPIQSTQQQTHLVVDKKLLEIETLVHYKIPFAIERDDRTNRDSITILEELNLEDVESLFGHIRSLRLLGLKGLHIQQTKTVRGLLPSSGDSGRTQSVPAVSVNSRKRYLNKVEENATWDFLEHCKCCSTCKDPYRVYRSNGTLCDLGSVFARDVAKLLELSKSGKVWSKVDQRQVNLGPQFEHLQNLLKAILKDNERDGSPFIRILRQRSFTRRFSVWSEFEKAVLPEMTLQKPKENEKWTLSTLPTVPGSLYEKTSPVSPGIVGAREFPFWRLEAELAETLKLKREVGKPARRLTPPEALTSPSTSKDNPLRKLLFDMLVKAEQQRQKQQEEEKEAACFTDSIPSTPLYSTDPCYLPTNQLADTKSGHETRCLSDNLAGYPLSLAHEASIASRAADNPPPVSMPVGPRDMRLSQDGLLDTTVEDDQGNDPRAASHRDEDAYVASERCSSEILDTGTPKFEVALGILDSALLEVKDMLLRGLVDYAAFEEATDALDGSKKRTRHSTSASSSTVSNRPPQKRLRGGDRDPSDGSGDDHDGDDHDDNDRAKKDGRPSSFSLLRRLKCPFYQREPDKYSRAACRGEGFADMAKLKDHIKRVHTQSLRCARCWLEMENDEAYADHLQAENSCDKQPQPADDRITHQTLKRLDFKKAPYAQAKNTEGKWKILFRVLFPHDIDVPSPYDQHGFTPRLEKILYESIEEELTRELAPALEPILERIRERIPAIIKTCKLRFLQASPGSAGTPDSVMLSSNTESDLGDLQQPDFHRREAEELCIENPSHTHRATRRANIRSRAKGKRSQHDVLSPSAGPSTDNYRASRHTPSTESSFDNLTTWTNPDLCDSSFGATENRTAARISWEPFGKQSIPPDGFPERCIGSDGDSSLFENSLHRSALRSHVLVEQSKQQNSQHIPTSAEYSHLESPPPVNYSPTYARVGTRKGKELLQESYDFLTTSDTEYMSDDYDFETLFPET